jgi:hypothetical protein
MTATKRSGWGACCALEGIREGVDGECTTLLAPGSSCTPTQCTRDALVNTNVLMKAVTEEMLAKGVTEEMLAKGMTAEQLAKGVTAEPLAKGMTAEPLAAPPTEAPYVVACSQPHQLAGESQCFG